PAPPLANEVTTLSMTVRPSRATPISIPNDDLVVTPPVDSCKVDVPGNDAPGDTSATSPKANYSPELTKW
ncbi:unnamed protein product, partial [Ilex paraguariensis]